MTTLNSEDRGLLKAGAHHLLDQRWSMLAGRPSVDLLELWSVAVGYGWFEFAESDDFAALLTVMGELGEHACPLPLADAFVAQQLLGDEYAKAIASGELRIVVDAVAQGSRVKHAEAGPALTHVVQLLPTGHASLREVSGVQPTPGLAAPNWSTVELGAEVARCRVPADRRNAGLTVLRLGAVTRAHAAAQRSHQLAVAHAKVRRQFGKAIGSFGAVQQRTAAAQIECASGAALLNESVVRYQQGRADWRLAAELAIEHIRTSAPSVQFSAHHTLAAIGYFEEHEAPWLFRRVHADLARLAITETDDGTAADMLVENAQRLPGLDVGAAGESFRAEVRAVLDKHRTGAPESDAFDEVALLGDVTARGWFALGWPAEYGGSDGSVVEQYVLHEEIKYNRAPLAVQLSAAMLLGSAILRHGTDEQKSSLLPKIRLGQLLYCLGYSEPEAGSDLASLKTRAEYDGDQWVINGEKAWTTDADVRTHVWLAVRTDPNAERPQAGITIFLVPLDTPGITIHPHHALPGAVACSVRYEDVRVPDSARVGEVNAGWSVIRDALGNERAHMGGIAAELRRQFDAMLHIAQSDPEPVVGPRGSAKRARLGMLAARLQATRCLVSQALKALGAGGGTGLEAPMAGVLGGEVAEELGEGMLEILGPAAALAGSAEDVPGGGAFEHGLRLSIKYVIGGGTNDIQRGLIARSLGLPR